MSTSYNSQDVKCPFYAKDTGTTITCEGFPESLTHSQRYKTKAQMMQQLELFCMTWNFTKCEVYRLIMESKYHD